jgi:LPS sulfotransferase NodH
VRYGPRAYEQPRHSLSHPEHDLPERDGPERSYVICSQPRCGSSLLSDWLFRTQCLGVPHEYLHPNAHMPFIARRLGLTDADDAVDVDAYIRRIKALRTTANGVFGVKAHWDQAAPLLKAGHFARHFGQARFIYLTRRDLLGQAISLALALQTGQYRAGADRTGEPAYDFKQICKAMTFVLNQRQGWEQLFALNGLAPLRLVYEDIQDRRSETVGRVCEHLGVDALTELPEVPEVPEPASTLTPQRDQTNRLWRERFVRDGARTEFALTPP